MTPDNEAGPLEETRGPADSLVGTGAEETVTQPTDDGDDLAAALRRRRAAALRLPPLQDGRRDPLLERRRSA